MARILVIDDDKLIRWSLKEIFSQEGLQVDTASAPQEALELATKSTYSLIFSDLEMNEDSSIEILKEINQDQPDTKIIILSALPITQIKSQLSGLMVSAVVEKPFDSDQIRALARRTLDLDQTPIKSQKEENNE